jgi:hypothetical protein
MSRLFPNLWATKKAGERWIVKNPLDAYRDIIRVWGGLNTYRPPGPDELVTGLGPPWSRSGEGARGGAGGAGGGHSGEQGSPVKQPGIGPDLGHFRSKV